MNIKILVDYIVSCKGLNIVPSVKGLKAFYKLNKNLDKYKIA